MSETVRKSPLSVEEKTVVKALLNDGWRNQDIQALINTGRQTTINFGRISGVKANSAVTPATRDQVERFKPGFPG